TVFKQQGKRDARKLGVKLVAPKIPRLMDTEYGIKTKKRPNLVKDLKPGDILHIGTEDKGEIFAVMKIGNKEYVLKQSDHELAYAHSRGVINQKIMDFDEKYDAYFLIEEGDLEDLDLDTSQSFRCR
ncbi:MAG: hypothetical protein GWP12_02010, partial [Nitrospirae bacterium]|nr:hypothetical protein [Nitrospirota bacterium]